MIAPEYQLLILIGSAAIGRIIAWMVGLPSIVFLLALGILCGPGLQLVDPSALFGALLTPFVSLVVAFVLFEGGMSINPADRSEVGGVATSLVFVGSGITLFAVAASAAAVFGVSIDIALVVGSCLMVTGPTVISPLLRTLRPRAPLGPILHWEGIFVDPVGVLCAVLIAEGVLQGSLSNVPYTIAVGMLLTLIGGIFFGIVGATTALFILKRHLLPDELHVTFVILLLGIAYVGAEWVHPHSGLLAATLMGVTLATKGGEVMHQISEFVETTQGLALAFLFVLLSAQLDRTQLDLLSWESVIFLGLVIGVIRPVAVFVSTFRSSLRRNEKWLLAFVAPRGIVAASLASVLSASLVEKRIEGAEIVVPLVFVVIIATVLFYGLLSPAICSALHVREANPQGVFIAGAGTFSRQLGTLLTKHNVYTLLVDSDRPSVNAATRAKLQARVGNVLSELFQSELDLSKIGHVLAITSNDEANSLIALEYGRIVGRRNVYQLQPSSETSPFKRTSPRGRILFSRPVSAMELEQLLESGYRLQAIPSVAGQSTSTVKLPEGALAILHISNDGSVTVASGDLPRGEGTLICFMPPLQYPVTDSTPDS